MILIGLILFIEPIQLSVCFSSYYTNGEFTSRMETIQNLFKGGIPIKEKIMMYIESNFPNLSSDLHLRFELGHPYKNGTEERINQVVTRVTTLFEEVFRPNDFIYLFIKDWNVTEDVMFGNNTPEYLYDLLSKQNIEEETFYDIDEYYDELTGQTIEIKNEYKVKFVYSRLKSISYKEVLEGIGNYEQGREPSIGESVYFISTEKGIIFHMYDDRGCDVFGLNKDTLVPVYHKFRKWILDYNRIEIDYAFEEGLFNYHETIEEREKRHRENRLKVKETKINLSQDNTCLITHALTIPNEYAEECINEIGETGFNIAISNKNSECTNIKVTKTEALGLVDYQTELMALYSKKYKGEYKGWSVKEAF